MTKTKQTTYAILCGYGGHPDYLTECTKTKAKDIEDAFVQAEDVCSNLENTFVFPINKSNKEKLQKVMKNGSRNTDTV